ncbi:MAG: hypothetical protein BJ554DRAFT_6433 [Olpidium bornovanus]|uniref:FAD/NAD(P)-binding domain-containing protein n=1 Tax=Olpidium bornovanus TaxID=278681 RepID=A0A8H7ZXZ5_9FUNG|nr:MAG: hypothetical protein BJ554DRAFT_6433 [Olpidium bornovanus]
MTGACAALKLASELPETHRVVLIEANDFAYWPPGALRACVLPGFEDSVFAALDKVFPPGSRHLVLAGTRVVSLNPNSVVVDQVREPFASTTIEFEYAVIATGSTYGAPCRPSGKTAAESLSSLREQQRQIKEARSLLVAGGGPVGIEFAGEVKAVHKDKKITLVGRGARLVGPQFSGKFHRRLLAGLEAIGVEVVLNDGVQLDGVRTGPVEGGARKFTTSSGKSIDADFVFVAAGGRPDASLISAADPAAVDADGRGKVDPRSLRFLSPKLRSYFGIGDAVDSPGLKTFLSGKAQAAAAAGNILTLVKAGSPDAHLNKAFKDPGMMMVVPLGPSGGASQLGSSFSAL